MYRRGCPRCPAAIEESSRFFEIYRNLMTVRRRLMRGMAGTPRISTAMQPFITLVLCIAAIQLLSCCYCRAMTVPVPSLRAEYANLTGDQSKIVGPEAHNAGASRDGVRHRSHRVYIRYVVCSASCIIIESIYSISVVVCRPAFSNSHHLHHHQLIGCSSAVKVDKSFSGSIIHFIYFHVLAVHCTRPNSYQS